MKRIPDGAMAPPLTSATRRGRRARSAASHAQTRLPPHRWLFALASIVVAVALLGCAVPETNAPTQSATTQTVTTPSAATPSPTSPNASTPSATPPSPTPQSATSAPENPDVILATTTSTQDSGLLDVLIPMFEQQTGYRVKPIAVGTGQALAMAERGEADVVLVHAPDAEKKVVEGGAAIERTLVMHNDFVVVGPPEDPAGAREAKTAAEALQKIAQAQVVFVSRGDESGTHQKEQSLWKSASLTPEGTWYQESGSGMGQTLGIASEKGGYTLTDRATYLATRENLHLEVLLEGDPLLLNIYHVMVVNPERFDKVNADGARAFAAFLVSSEGQEAIRTFGVDKYGEPLFFPDAGKTEDELLGG